jgi:hypothetical protein
MFKYQQQLNQEQRTALEQSLHKLEAHYHSPSGYARVHVIRAKRRDLGEYLSPETDDYHGMDAD